MLEATPLTVGIGCLLAFWIATWLFTENIALKKTVLDLRPGTFSRRKVICDTINASNITGVFTQNGDTWKRHRRLTSPAFSRPNVASVVPKIQTVARVLVDKWSKRSAGGTGEPLCSRCAAALRTAVVQPFFCLNTIVPIHTILLMYTVLFCISSISAIAS
eukprot:3150-Heterococcus_DN1.PRE.1